MAAHRLLLAFAFAASLWSAGRRYQMEGRITPGAPASVSLFGATTPFHTSTLSDRGGQFRFRELWPGQYTVVVFVPGTGEARRTVEVGPGTSDAKHRVRIHFDFEDSRAVSSEALRAGAVVSARALSIPDAARRAYAGAQTKLARHDVESAIVQLRWAVEIAPHFAAAWNNLGTIAYQSRAFSEAESHFRTALEHEPGSFEPLVNLGGVLLTEEKLTEALQYNRHAVLTRPRDALANAQLGLTYFALGNLDLAHKHLVIATQIDPAHFSYPQLTLAQIYARRGDLGSAAEQFREFLKHHPDAPQAARARLALEKADGPAALAAGK